MSSPAFLAALRSSQPPEKKFDEIGPFFHYLQQFGDLKIPPNYPVSPNIEDRRHEIPPQESLLSRLRKRMQVMHQQSK